jgi:pyruvate kinase
MLSGESAAGKYPVEAVAAMAQIAEYTEQHTDYKQRFLSTEYNGQNNLDSISHAVCSMAMDVNAKAIVVCSVSGKTAMLVSRFRTPVNIIGMTTDTKIWRRLSMSWGVTPVMAEQFPSMDVMFYYAQKAAAEVLNLQKGDNVVLTGGPINGQHGNTNTIKIERI